MDPAHDGTNWHSLAIGNFLVTQFSLGEQYEGGSDTGGQLVEGQIQLGPQVAPFQPGRGVGCRSLKLVGGWAAGGWAGLIQ